ncbi:hypothetical protein V3C99_018457 [Haemonchus contortus]|uniref:Ty3-gypsy retrotransposon protein n=1 Tax=Haemonchus contortus TaxID=6289 RepID=A0A7I5EDW8_HAECO
MDRLYESRTQGDEELAYQREQQLQIEDPQMQIKDVMAIIEIDVRRLQTTMKEIKEYMAAAERPRKGESLAIQIDVNKGRTVVVQEGTQVAERQEDPKKSLPAQVKERGDREATASEETDKQYFGRLVLETNGAKRKAKDRMLSSSVEKAVIRQEPSEGRQNQLQRKRTSSDKEPIAMAGRFDVRVRLSLR